jgi:hypothetical protein
MVEMSDVLASPEMVQFAVNVAKATYQGNLGWETTADEDALVAPLGDAYTAMIERSWAADENDEAYREYKLVLSKAGNELFRLTPYALQSTDFTRLLGTSRTPYQVFEQVWTRANWKAKKVTDELLVVNRLLGSKLNREEKNDEDEVPF